MKIKKTISPKVVSLSFGILILLFAVSFYIFAWTEPNTAPPGGNVSAPINTGSNSQHKIGRLQIGNSDPAWINDSITGFTEPVVNNDGFVFVPGYTGAEDSDLRLYMLDNSAERFSIWGDSCGGGNCGELNNANLKHYFTGGGDAWHKGKMTATEICLEGKGCKSDWSQITGTSYWTASGNNIYSNNSGNVGIGTASPGYKLDINGTIRARDFTGAGGKNIIVGDDTYLTDVDSANMLGIYGMQNSDRAGIRLGSDGSYIFGDNGNVGIGTASPGSKLDVVGQIKTNSIYVNAGEGLEIENGGSGYGPNDSRRINLRDGNPPTDGALVITSDVSSPSDAGNLIAYFDKNKVMFSGNVGIGTASPGYKLTVNGPIGTPNMNHPYLVLDSSSSGSNTNEQSAQISLGESGRGSASLHLAYTGDGYSYIGMGNLGSDNIPDHWAMKLHYTDNDIYAHNNINTNDVYIRSIGKWASTLGGADLHGWSFQNDKLLDDGENVIQTSDEWLRLNQNKHFSNGVYTPGKLRADGGLYVSDDEYFYRNSEDFIRTGDHFQSDASVRAPIFYDSNNTSYYANPASISYFNDMRANIYYDKGDTSYYANPASTSRFNSLRFDGELMPDGATCSNGQILKKTGSNNWDCVNMPSGGTQNIQQVLDTGNDANERDIWDIDQIEIRYLYGQGDIHMRDSIDFDGYDIKDVDDIDFDGELMPDGATCSNGQILKKSGSNNWDCVNMPSGGTSGSGSTNYIPKWTGSTSLGNSVIYQSGSNIGIGDTSPDSKLDVEGGDIRISTAGKGLYFPDGTKQTTAATAGGGENLSQTLAIGNSAGSYDINMNGRDIVGVDRLVAYSGDYVEVKSSSASYGLIVRDYNSSEWINIDANNRELRNSTGNFSLNTAGDLYLNPTGGQTYATDFRANIYYDRNDTNFRIDPNGTSKLNDLYMYDDLFIGSSAGDNGADMYIADKLYDWDNTGYYLDPDSTSKLNVVYGKSFLYWSDKSLKTNIKPISNSLEKVLRLQGVNFDWKDDDTPSIGFIAQDVEKIFPEAVSTDSSTSLKSINYGVLVAPLAESIKEQQGEIESQRKEIDFLKEQIQILKAKIK